MRRHAVVDTLGLVRGLCTTPASVAGGQGARAAATEARAASGGRLSHPWADSAYRALPVAFCRALSDPDPAVEVVTLREGAVGFEVIPRRWAAERTSGRLTRWRRLNRNSEHTLAGSQAVVQVARIGIVTRGLAKTNKL